MISKRVFLAVVVCLITGCGKSNPAPPSADPVAEFKAIVSRFMAKETVSDTSYDVTKTDSLVSPLQGTFRYSYIGQNRRGHSEPGVAYWQAAFTYQDKQWALQRVCCRVNDTGETVCDGDFAHSEYAEWESSKEPPDRKTP